MIFVTVGTHYQGFERLVKAVDELVGNSKIKDNVIIQIGHTKYKPKNCEWIRFVNPENFVKLCKKSNIVITHGGIGSIVIPLKIRKPTIVVPRYKKFSEHTDDHQLQITMELQKERKIIAVYDIDDLEEAYYKTKKYKPTYQKKKNRIVDLIENFIKKVEKHG